MNAGGKRIIATLVRAPDDQITPNIKKRINNLKWCEGGYARTHLKTIIDDCVAGSLASDFAVACMVEAHRIDDFWN